MRKDHSVHQQGFSTALLFTLFTLFVSLSAICFGAQHAYAAAGHATQGFGEWFAESGKNFWFNFLLFWTVVFFLLRNTIRTQWAARRETLSDSVNQGEQEAANALAALNTAEARHAEIDTAKQQARDEIRNSTEREVAEIKAEAQRKAEQIAQHAAHSAAAEKTKQQRALREEIAAAVVSRAQEKLSQRLDYEADRALRYGSIKELQQLH